MEIIIILFIIIQVLSWYFSWKKKKQLQGEDKPKEKETPFQKFINDLFSQMTDVKPAQKSSMGWDEFMEEDLTDYYDDEDEIPPPPPITKKKPAPTPEEKPEHVARAAGISRRRKKLRNAIIWAEIIAPPVGLQNRNE